MAVSSLADGSMHPAMNDQVMVICLHLPFTVANRCCIKRNAFYPKLESLSLHTTEKACKKEEMNKTSPNSASDYITEFFRLNNRGIFHTGYTMNSKITHQKYKHSWIFETSHIHKASGTFWGAVVTVRKYGSRVLGSNPHLAMKLSEGVNRPGNKL